VYADALQHGLLFLYPHCDPVVSLQATTFGILRRGLLAIIHGKDSEFFP